MICATSTTARPAPLSAAAVPPVEMQLDAGFGERARQIDEARLVGNGEQRPPDSDDIGCHMPLAPSPSRVDYVAVQ